MEGFGVVIERSTSVLFSWIGTKVMSSIPHVAGIGTKIMRSIPHVAH